MTDGRKPDEVSARTWNATYPVGTAVRVESAEAETLSPAYTREGDGAWVVIIRVPLRHVEPLCGSS